MSKETEIFCGVMIISINKKDVSDSFVVTSCSLISLTIDTRKNDGRYFCNNTEWSSVSGFL